MATQVTFNASEWMNRFQAVGGHAYLAHGRLILGWMLDGFGEAANLEAPRIFKEVQHNGERLAELKTLIQRDLPAHSTGEV